MAGAEGWDARSVLRFDRSLENLSVTQIRDRSELVDAFIGAAADLGFPRNDDFMLEGAKLARRLARLPQSAPAA